MVDCALRKSYATEPTWPWGRSLLDQFAKPDLDPERYEQRYPFARKGHASTCYSVTEAVVDDRSCRGDDTVTIEYLLLDLPSDHEVEDGLVTECDVVRAIISNKRQGKKVKTVRSTTAERFLRTPTPTKSVKYVHLAGHGNPTDLCLIGGEVQWKKVAEHAKTFVSPLSRKQQRVLCISCCCSHDAAKEMSPVLKGYFTGIYYFPEDRIGFALAMTVWSMFYHRKGLDRPHKNRKIVAQVNKFFGEKVLLFMKVQGNKRRRPTARKKS